MDRGYGKNDRECIRDGAANQTQHLQGSWVTRETLHSELLPSLKSSGWQENGKAEVY